VLEQFFDNLKASFGLVGFNVDYLESRYIVDWMGREIAKVSNAIDGFTQLMGKRPAR
jgi:uncharacterized membrane protein